MLNETDGRIEITGQADPYSTANFSLKSQWGLYRASGQTKLSWQNWVGQQKNSQLRGANDPC